VIDRQPNGRTVFERFWLAFIPLLVAVDALALVPLYWGLAEGVAPHQRRQAVHQAALVGWLVGLTFLVISGWILRMLDMTMSDVLIAGGLTLFALALNDLIRGEQARSSAASVFGVVPLGVPLMVGPAVLTTLLLLRERHGVWLTAVAFNLNILLAWALLLSAERLSRWMGREGAKVISKVANLILAAFAVKLVRQGLSLWLAH
jgi:multiple antibiotic resistance protein